MGNPYDYFGSGTPAEYRDGLAVRNTSDATKVGIINAPATQVTATRVTNTLPDVAGQLVNDADLGLTVGRIALFEQFDKTPQLSAVTQLPGTDTYNTATFLASLAANRYFEVLGTNAISTDVTEYAEGGIAVAAHGATNDSTIILPHLTTNQSPWTRWTWGSDQQTEWECSLQTPAAVTALKIWAGLKLTNTNVIDTDAKQAFFLYDTASATSPATKWHTIYSINNVDTEAAVGSTVAAATNYTLRINIDSSRVPRFYLDGTLVTTGTALDNTTDYIPYIGILDTSAGSARTMYVFHEMISRKSGA